MPKLNKQMYYNAKGEQKINCYKVNISKEVVKESEIKDEENVKIYAKNKKIIIERDE